MRKWFVKSNQKIQHKKVNKNLLFLTGKLVALQQSTAYGLLCSSTQWSKRTAKKEVVLVEFYCFFSGKTDQIKNTKINNQTYLWAPQTLWHLRKQKKNHAAYLWQKNQKERKGDVWEECLFLHKRWGSAYPSSCWFFKLWQLWALFCCVRARIHLLYRSTWATTTCAQIAVIS